MSRRRARRVAVEVLYAADVRGAPARAVLDERLASEATVPDYASVLVDGVDRRRDEIDALLTARSSNWRPDRMSAVDRNVLRVGALELLEGENPKAVVISEAVEIAKTLSGEEAGRFVNGVLSAVARSCEGG